MKDDILRLIPLLSKADLKKIKALVDKRLAGEASDNKDVDLVVRLLNEMLSRKFITLRPEWTKNAVDLVSFVDETFPQATKVQRVAAIKLCLGLIIDDLKGRISIVPPGAVLLNLGRLPEVFDGAFPDYRKGGLSALILKQMKRNQ